jgi:hypothetical protein
MLLYTLETFLKNAFLLHAAFSGANKSLNSTDEFVRATHRYLTEIRSHFIKWITICKENRYFKKT